MEIHFTLPNDAEPIQLDLQARPCVGDRVHFQHLVWAHRVVQVSWIIDVAGENVYFMVHLEEVVPEPIRRGLKEAREIINRAVDPAMGMELDEG